MVEPKIITKEYLKEVDEALEMIPLTFDVVLKAVFVRNLDLLKKFIIDVLNLDIDPDKAKIRLSNNKVVRKLKFIAWALLKLAKNLKYYRLSLY